MQHVEAPPALFAGHSSKILAELISTLAAVREDQVAAAIEAILRAPRIFVTGAGRSGLAIRMIAMRLMHLGLTVHVAGETTTPAIQSGDLLLVASASGSTRSAVSAAEVAREVRAEILVVTTAPASRLAQLAHHLIEIPAAARQDGEGTRSQQYAGALFEQALLLTLDAAFQQMWQSGGDTRHKLDTRHANLE